MRDTNLVNALREHAEWARANEWEAPITLGDDLVKAADRIEAQAKEIEKLRGQNEQLREAAAGIAELGRVEGGAGHSTERIRLSATQSVLLRVSWQSAMDDSRPNGDDYPLDAAAGAAGCGKC